jgi:DnaJ-class molecular chaperone
MIPHECPFCHGVGFVNHLPGLAKDVWVWVSSSSGPYECRTCQGTGVVWSET